eukprot:CAMPEP_0113395232 /NCGR_PEP_ID=MMETSP0013_2-20120614/13053_1 /TAXON_ID=2843 ORGANISM="Skeletonema costatum, Strain 1716" /NCGR_SAMPLE_ID=MMETSP0013_2 /ASSEMBLY_ACC=CAM_ASM_000158 /LENGTH=198 /DNA_ID=CAMNT_0000279367 /DNA_START=308 /DNA_END=901 /DNA_ORIENTATION=+ /assembly_acc=CAM_ASM_000158
MYRPNLGNNGNGWNPPTPRYSYHHATSNANANAPFYSATRPPPLPYRGPSNAQRSSENLTPEQRARIEYKKADAARKRAAAAAAAGKRPVVPPLPSAAYLPPTHHNPHSRRIEQSSYENAPVAAAGFAAYHESPAAAAGFAAYNESPAQLHHFGRNAAAGFAAYDESPAQRHFGGNLTNVPPSLPTSNGTGFAAYAKA